MQVMDKFPFAQRTNWSQQSNALSKALEQLREQGVDILDLTASNPTNCGFSYPQETLAALGSLENLQYQPDACGMKKARDAVAGYCARQQQHLSADHVILTASTSEAYSFLMRLLVDPGEGVLAPRPSYPLFQFLLEINDVHVDYYPLSYDGLKWHLDLPALQQLVEEKSPKAIILVNPNNPTGSYISREELDFLNELCSKHQVAIISDEVFFEYALGEADFVSLAGNRHALTFILGGISKALGLPQMKCSWILSSGPQEAWQESMARLEIIADTYLSVNTPVQHALGAWLKGVSGVQQQITTRVKENKQWLDLQLRHRPSLSLLSLEGGWYATLRIPGLKSEEEQVLEFLREDHVLVYPGYFFDFEKEAYIILSLISPIATFREGVGRILQRLEKI